ncbi:MAG TPA: adenylate/guanylate cyclase domain-containing protein, partial [Actinomycetota bacterium]|nr:adenylate/guanylate cyclase domain-containing protein [Actinomycetota bacterium]
TVTFLFSDIEGSTRLVQALGDRYVSVLEDQQRVLREAFAAHDGVELGTEGDSFFVVFPAAPDAVAAALEAQQRIAAHAWPEDAVVRVRMGLHTGAGTRGGDNYIGLDVNRAARIAGVAHGGQVLISESTRSLAEQSLDEGVGLRDLGEHRLKDLLEPERIFQLEHPALPVDFPPLASLSYRPNNLPTQTSEFLGREAELAAIGDLLDGGARVVTLTGPGGMGKTRLSLQVAASRLEAFKDGLFFVDLTPIREADPVFEAIAHTVGIQGSGDIRPLELLKRELATKRMLLVLDNFEQVIVAAPGVAELLNHCPDVRVLATSREALRIRGEHVFPVAPMSVPPRTQGMTAETAATYEAVRLFVERAAAASGSFALTDDNATAVAEICARLDGLPLAIELAAARVRLFSAQDLLGRLERTLQIVAGGARDLPERHQTLRRTIEWSYDLLDAEERDVFRVLSVFPSAPLSAVEEVAVRISPLRDVLVVDRVASLVDKSLVRSANGTGPQRLSMLATVQEFATERLETEPELAASARRAHAEFFSEFARRTRDRLEGAERATALGELQTETENLLAAWRYWFDAGDLEQLEELLDPLWALLDARGWYTTAVTLARDLLAALSDVPSTPDRIQQRITLATSLARGILALHGTTKEFEDAYGRVLQLLDQAGSLPQLYPVLVNLAKIHQYRAEFDKALSIGRRLLELAEQADDDALRGEAHLVIGSNLDVVGGPDVWLRHLEKAVELFDPARHKPRKFRLGPNPGIVSLTTSSFGLWLIGEPDRAIGCRTRALELADRLDHPYSLAYALYHTSFLDLWRREYELVHEGTAAAIAVSEEHGYEIWKAVGMVLQGAALIALGRQEEGLARGDQGFSLVQALSTPPVFTPFILGIRATALGLAGRPTEALEIVDQVFAMAGPAISLLASEFPVLKGDLELAASGPESAEPWFELALSAARQNRTRSTQLRALTRLTHLRRRSGRQPDGSDELREVYDTFAGQADTKDLADARAVLES